ncbi:hypothetical protein F5Y12DRAFT_716255 [Xylaria sp. FL1777]|nr:hypothetical protein F5Y12DRAFT_716255 [Xylaria sp. FL1777]
MILRTRMALLFWTFALYISTCAANLPLGVAGPPWPSFFQAPEFHLNIAKRDVEGILKPRDNAPGPRWPTIFEAPDFHLNIAKRDVEGVFKGDENAPGPRWPTIFEAPDFHLNIAASDIVNVVKDIVSNAEGWITQAQEQLQKDPAPGLLWGPALNWLGFGIGGVGQAAAWQSAIGTPAARSIFAYLQSAGAAGYGAAAMDSVVRGGILINDLLRIFKQ